MGVGVGLLVTFLLNHQPSLPNPPGVLCAAGPMAVDDDEEADENADLTHAHRQLEQAAAPAGRSKSNGRI